MSDLSQNQFRRVAPRGGAGRILLAVALIALVAIGFALDVPFGKWLARRENLRWEALVQIITRGGDWPFLALATAGGILLARIFRRRRAMTLLLVMFVATIAAGAAVQPLRMLSGRSRPHPKRESGWYGLRKDGEWIVGRHRYSAFPSAHTTVAAAFVTPAILIGGFRWLPLWLLPMAVGASRVALTVHHPSDVVVGLIVGAGAGWLIARSPRIRWWSWRASSVFCGYGGGWPRSWRADLRFGEALR